VSGYNSLKQFFVKWVEEYLFFPTPFQTLISLLLLPFTLIYCVITTYKRISKKAMEFGVPVISIGNLLIGGTGKTPVIINLAQRYKNSAVVLRGYGRDSKGLYVISDGKTILESLETAGDEATLLAQALPKSIIIVSENRIAGVQKAKELGAEVVFLDDGYRHHEIKKFDILLRPKNEPSNIMCLPSGGYRDTKMMYSFADTVLKEGEEFQRKVSFYFGDTKVESLPKNTVLLTAISKANRLFEFLPKGIEAVIYEDHHRFTSKDVEELYKKYPHTSIVTTQKDYVKLEQFDLENLYLMKLDLKIDENTLKGMEQYIKSYQAQI
jgi:tetraacyldisaccharide 4'-kinase